MTPGSLPSVTFFFQKFPSFQLPVQHLHPDGPLRCQGHEDQTNPLELLIWSFFSVTSSFTVNLWSCLGRLICFPYPVVVVSSPFTIEVSFAAVLFFPFLLPALLLRLLVNSFLPLLLPLWQELVYPSYVSLLYQSEKLSHNECYGGGDF